MRQFVSMLVALLACAGAVHGQARVTGTSTRPADSTAASGRARSPALTRAAPRTTPKVSPWSAAATMSSVFDSNIDRDDENLDVYGVVSGVIGRYRTRTSRQSLEMEYESALHSYTGTNRWDRVSHRFRGLYEREVASDWTLATVTEIALKGSSEDRSVGDQYVLEPRLEYEFDRSSQARLYGAARVRKFDDTPDQNGLNRYVGIEFTQDAGNDREWEVGARYEVNGARTVRRRYNRWTWHTKYTTEVGDRDELELEVKIRSRTFPKRFVEVEDEDVPRRDQRFIPSVVWTRALGDQWGLNTQYEYETRASNDPEQDYTGHQLRVSFIMRIR